MFFRYNIYIKFEKLVTNVIPEKYVSEVSTSFLIEKMGTHLETGFDESLPITSEAVNKRIDSLDFSSDSDTTMQVFEKLGPSYYNSDEEMLSISEQGVSSLRYINNSLGEKLAKEECLEHFISFVNNTIWTNKSKLKRIKGILPVFMLNKEDKDKYQRLSKKIEIMDAIKSGNRDIIEQYHPIKEIIRLKRDKEISVITPLDDKKEFFFVDIRNITIEPVFPIMAQFRDFFVDDKNVDGYIEYHFINENGDFKHAISMKDIEFFQTGVIHINSQSCIFEDKKDAIALLTKEKERINKAFNEVL